MSFNNHNDNGTTSWGGGGEGGGFMAGGSQQSPSTTRNQRDDSVRPVTIKQLNDAESTSDTDFKLDGSQIGQVTFVAQVRNISPQTTNITYKLSDGTGSIEVKKWHEHDDADEGVKSNVSENDYVRVWGRLKSFGGRRHVVSNFVRPIADHNEISYHLLEATAIHLYFTRGPPNSGAKAGGANNGAAQQQDTGMGGGGPNVPSNLSAVAKKVYQCLAATPQGNEGLHCEDLAARLGMNTADVTRSGDELLERGLIYTTVDDYTWAIMNM